MASNLGSLTVSLGLDAAEYTRGMEKAQKDAYNLGYSIGEDIRKGATVGAAALAALGVAAAATFSKLIDGAGKFADIADKTGASAEALASFQIAAKTSDVSIEKIGSSMNMLTRNLVGVNDESKAAGAALKALGIPLQDFKALKPEEQVEKVSQTLATFEDGAQKSAVAMALFRSSGAEILPFLKTLEEQGGRRKILTEEQIAIDDAYLDRQAAMRAEVELYAQALASQAVPMISAFTGALTDTIKEIIGVDEQTKKLSNSTAVADFAEGAVRALGFIIDAGDGVVRTFQVIGTAIGATAAAAAAVVRGEFAQTKSIADAADADIAKILQRPQFSAILDKRIQEAKEVAKKVAPKVDRPTPNYNGPVRSSAGKDTSAQEAKAQLASDLADYKRAADAIVDENRNAERILGAERSAGLKDESAYYAEKIRLMESTASAQEDGLRKQIARMERERLEGKAAIDNAKKIEDAKAKLAQTERDAAAAAKVASIEHEAAMKRMEATTLAARQAAQDYFDTTNRGYQRQLEGLGQGNKYREYISGLQQVEERYLQQRQNLFNNQQQSIQTGSFGADAQKQYDRQLADIQEFEAKAIESYKSTYAQIQEAQKNWLTGASEALRNYSDEAANVAKHTEDTVNNALKGIEDGLTSLLSGDKWDIQSFLKKTGQDLTRNFVKENITGPLSGFLANTFGVKISDGAAKLGTPTNPMYVKMVDPIGGGSGGMGNSLATLFANGMGGDSLDNLIGLTNGWGTGGGSWVSSLMGLFSGGRAIGGPVDPGKLYQVNERGPEMLNVGGKQLLMMGSQGGTVTPSGGMGGLNYSPVFQIDGTADRASTEVSMRKIASQAVQQFADQLKRVGYIR